MKYRREIDGLRAVAVIPVLFFHAGFPGFSGGYIGVDIFFVISGFLITSIILQDLKQGQFSILNFYERRARRILPALSAVLLVTTLAAFLIMPPSRMEIYTESLVSVVTFSSNVYFYLTSGYFSPAAEEKPLLHIWSLAVEEQFYLFFPLLLAFLWRFGKKRAQGALVLTAVLSLVYAQYLSQQGMVDANFYLIFSRAWELLVGSLLALYAIPDRNLAIWKRELIGVAGLAMIGVSIFVFDSQTPFPSVYTLVPVLATALIIGFINQGTLVGKFLSNRFFVFIGLISYSLYLWHQPILAFLRFRSLREPGGGTYLLVMLVSILLAFLSWKFVETPFRDRTAISRRMVFGFSAASISIFLVIGLVGHFNHGYPGRFRVPDYSATIKHSPKRNACHASARNYIPPENACRYFHEDVTWAVFGDSHLVEINYALAEELEVYQQGLLHLSFSDCPPALLFETKTTGCTAWIQASLRYLENNSQIKNVLVGFRYSNFLFGSQLNRYPELPDKIDRQDFPLADPAHSDQELRELYWQSLSEIIARLRAAGKTVYILYPVPELPAPINKIIQPALIFSDQSLLDLERTTSAEYYLSRNQFILAKLDSLSYGEDLVAIKPFEILCDGRYCPAALAGEALYFDDHHLSISGAELIAQEILPDPYP